MNRLIFFALCVSASFGAGKAECADGSCQGKDSTVLLQANVQHDVAEHEHMPTTVTGQEAADNAKEVEDVISEIQTWGMETEDMEQVRALLSGGRRRRQGGGRRYL